MPKNLFQEIIFTIIMVIVMVYAMICYNIALSTGGMSNFVFLAAFKELAVMGPIAFVLDFFLVGKIAKARRLRWSMSERTIRFTSLSRYLPYLLSSCAR